MLYTAFFCKQANIDLTSAIFVGIVSKIIIYIIPDHCLVPSNSGCSIQFELFKSTRNIVLMISRAC